MINVTFVIAGHTPNAPPPKTYWDAAKRFADTYRAFPAEYEHRLVLIDSNDGLTPEVASFFQGINYDVIKYRGSGWDIGAHIFAALNMPADDWIMPFSSWVHFKQKGWLRAFADARERHGDSLYGSMVSFEHRPHVRGTGFFLRCEKIHRYPYGCNSRRESLCFEVGPNSMTAWCRRQGYGAWLVTPEAVVPIMEARNLRNVFRRGDQSNIWTYDKHTDIFERATEDERKTLNKLAYDFENSAGANTGLILLRPEVSEDLQQELMDEVHMLVRSHYMLTKLQSSVVWRAIGPMLAARRWYRGLSPLTR